MLRILRHEEPAYIPFGMEATKWVQHRDSLFYRQNGDPKALEWTDAWGVDFRLSDPDFKDSAFPVSHPISSVDQIDEIRWPDPKDPAVYQDMIKEIEETNRGDTLIVSVNPGVLFVRSWLLMGMENLFIEILIKESAIDHLLERITEYQVAVAKQIVAHGIDIATLHDDAAGTTSLYTNPDTWRRLVKPRLKRIVDVYKNAGCFVLFHCCGHVMQILQDIIDIGFDVLNPIQVIANDLPELRSVTQGRLALFGGIDADAVMQGTPEKVAALTYDALYDLGENGDYIAFADQVLPFPAENLAAMEQVIAEIGLYPLGPREIWNRPISRTQPSAGRMLTGS